MFAKYKDKIMTWLNGLSPPQNIKASKMVIFGAFGLVLIVVILYIAGWCFNTYKTGTANLKDLEALLVILVSPQDVAFVTFASVYMVDADGDGMPDAAENKANEGIKNV